MRALSVLLSFLGATTLVACGDNHDHGVDPDASADVDVDARPPADAGIDAASTGQVTLAFDHLVDGAAITLGNDTPYLDAVGNQFGVAVVRYFIADLSLTYADGSTWDAPGAHYVDHELSETRTYALPPDAPVGDLATVRFVMGLPPALDVTGAFSSPPESLMEWPEMMGGGYHYMKFEGRYIDDAGAPFNFKMHSGALGGTDYSFEVVLDADGLAVTPEGTTLRIEMNLEQWFTAPDDWDLDDYFNATHPGIMNDAAAQASLQRNGATVFTVGQP
ncbi:MAG: hypothetical protein H6709_17535 [Kofleriaceae bacterium]|nr:hypothetical protein [Myxococcales bacterium]MCB9564461.1 hypothetical protein [Kofleriaceae bacterium]MCB9573886.1 hypothetical protein [Kofleriaceae bacterium]